MNIDANSPCSIFAYSAVAVATLWSSAFAQCQTACEELEINENQAGSKDVWQDYYVIGQRADSEDYLSLLELVSRCGNDDCEPARIQLVGYLFKVYCEKSMREESYNELAEAINWFIAERPDHPILRYPDVIWVSAIKGARGEIVERWKERSREGALKSSRNALRNFCICMMAIGEYSETIEASIGAWKQFPDDVYWPCTIGAANESRHRANDGDIENALTAIIYYMEAESKAEADCDRARIANQLTGLLIDVGEIEFAEFEQRENSACRADRVVAWESDMYMAEFFVRSGAIEEAVFKVQEAFRETGSIHGNGYEYSKRILLVCKEQQQWSVARTFYEEWQSKCIELECKEMLDRSYNDIGLAIPK